MRPSSGEAENLPEGQTRRQARRRNHPKARSTVRRGGEIALAGSTLLRARRRDCEGQSALLVVLGILSEGGRRHTRTVA
jgi:hypothetical protein